MLLTLWLQERGKLSRNQIYLTLFMRHILIIEAEYFVVLSYVSIILDAFKKEKRKKKTHLWMLQENLIPTANSYLKRKINMQSMRLCTSTALGTWCWVFMRKAHWSLYSTFKLKYVSGHLGNRKRVSRGVSLQNLGLCTSTPQLTAVTSSKLLPCWKSLIAELYNHHKLTG